MGQFFNLRDHTGRTRVEDETARAVLALPLLVAAADGEISPPETTQITNMCAFSPVFHAIGPDRTMALAGEVVAELKARGATEVFKRAAAVLSPNLRETAMCFAIRTALADGKLEEGEKKMLINMGESLAIPEETFFRIFDVMVMMQRAPGA